MVISVIEVMSPYSLKNHAMMTYEDFQIKNYMRMGGQLDATAALFLRNSSGIHLLWIKVKSVCMLGRELRVFRASNP
jgi:hypothetical protein